MATETIESKASFAKRLGLSRGRISQLAKQGLPMLPDGSVRVEAALKWVRSELKPGPGRPHGAVEGGGRGEGREDMEAAKIRLLLAQASRQELELAHRRGELVPAEEARRAVRAVAFVTREAMLNFPARYGAEIAGELGVDPGTLIALLDARVRTEMNRVAAKAPSMEGE